MRDDAPLRLTRVEARVPQPELYLAAPAGEYSLLLGFPDAPLPRYELARVRATVLAVPAAAVVTGSLERNPDYRAGARLGSGKGLQQVLLWIVLGVAVVGLVGLTLWLARQNQPSETE